MGKKLNENKKIIEVLEAGVHCKQCNINYFLVLMINENLDAFQEHSINLMILER